MIIISDTSPLNYLVLIGHVEIVRELYGRVIIPQAVYDELQAPETPPEVQAWLANCPAWLDRLARCHPSFTANHVSRLPTALRGALRAVPRKHRLQSTNRQTVG